MTAPMILLNECPTQETIAAFVDDRLDSATRANVTEHIADCGDCRELVLMTTDFQRTEMPANVRQGTFGSRGWRAAAGLAAAAAIAVFVLQRGPGTPDIDDVVKASQTLKQMPVSGRLVGFPYKEKKPTFRSANGQTNLEEELQRVDLLQLADELEKAKVRDRYVSGVTNLLLGDARQAVPDLEEAAKTGGKDHDAILVALATALLQRRDEQQHDDERALALSEDVWKRAKLPEAAFNRAQALENLGRDEDAMRAWDDYLKIDSTSAWAEEARSRKQLLSDLPR